MVVESARSIETSANTALNIKHAPQQDYRGADWRRFARVLAGDDRLERQAFQAERVAAGGAAVL